jgi:hypothetical protein
MKLANTTWTRKKLIEFAAAYRDAVHRGHNEFEFEGHKFLVTYAKFLIEYLDKVLPRFPR